jgi:hypothetical protein
MENLERIKRYLKYYHSICCHIYQKSCLLIYAAIDDWLVTYQEVKYQYSLLLSAPLALLAGAFTMVVPAAYVRVKHRATTAKTLKTSTQ